MTSKQRIRLMALWGERWRSTYSIVDNLISPSSSEECRDGRLVYLAQICGRVLDSANELTEADAGKAIAALESERPKKLIAFPNRNRISKEQIWKIRQLEASEYLGWASESKRLAGFLREQYRGATRPEQLSFKDGWKAIEALFRIAARQAVQRSKGAGYKVPGEELLAEVKRIKVALQGWQPPSEMPAAKGSFQKQ